MRLNIETETADTILKAVEKAITAYYETSFFKTSDTIKALSRFVSQCQAQSDNEKVVYLDTQVQVQLLHLVFGYGQYQESVNTHRALAGLRYQLSGATLFKNDRLLIKDKLDAFNQFKTTVDTLYGYQCITPEVIQQLGRLYSGDLTVYQYKALARFDDFVDHLNAIDLQYPLLQPAILLAVMGDGFFDNFPHYLKIVSHHNAKRLFSGLEGLQRFECLTTHPNAAQALAVMSALMRYVPILLAKRDSEMLFDLLFKPEWKVIAVNELFDMLKPGVVVPYDEVLLLDHSAGFLETLLHLQLPASDNPLEAMRKIIGFIPYLPYMKDSSPLHTKLDVLHAFLACSKTWLTSKAYTFFFEEAMYSDHSVRKGFSCEQVRPYLGNKPFFDQLIIAAQMSSWFGEAPPSPDRMVSKLLNQLIHIIIEKRRQWGRLPSSSELSLDSEVAESDALPRYTALRM